MANTAFVTISAVTPAALVPDAGGAGAVARFSAVVLTPGGSAVGYDGQQGVSDVVSVAIDGGDTLPAIQARITSLLQSAAYYNDGGLAVVFV